MLPLVHPFTWALSLIAIPVVIHLINMMRHQRVEWAAMEFLLLSQKKHRTWVILKQLLLLLLRMLAIAGVVLALAQPLLPDRWGNFLGSQPTHHIVVLDDSFSMSDHWGDTTAFDRAKKVLERLGASVVHPQQPQSFTLLRLSHCGMFGEGTKPDFHKEKVDSEFAVRLTEKLQSMQVSETAAEPLPALEAVRQALSEDTGERRIVYFLSDFRARQWDKPDELKKRLLQLDESHAEIRLIDCVAGDASRPNLAITSLEPEEGIRAAGVRWRMQITVRNFGPTSVRNIPVYWSADGKAGPQVVIDEIPAGDTARQWFDVVFPTAGEHLLSAHLDADAVLADNVRHARIDLPVDVPVLLVDGEPAARDSKFVAWSLVPGGEVRTGVRAWIETPRYLALKPLDEFGAISVANVDRLDRSAIEALEKYVSAGGGLIFFVGPQTRSDFVNRELYRDGKGLFPVPLANPESLPVDTLDKTPDVQSGEHFIFRFLGNHRADHLSKILVKQYFTVSPDWIAKNDPSTRVIAQLRNRAPLLVEKSHGRGRVMAFLSTASPSWNNWASNSETVSFPVVVQEIVAYLSHRPSTGASYLVGEPIAVKLDPAKYQPTIHFAGPGGGPSATIDAAVDAPAKGASNQLAASFARTEKSGFYEALLTQTTGKGETRHYAVNVDPAEGDLKALAGAELAARLAPAVKYQFDYADSFETKIDETAGRNLGDLLIYLLIAALIGEQLLAWSLGYHPIGSNKASSRRAAPLMQGGAL